MSHICIKMLFCIFNKRLFACYVFNLYIIVVIYINW